MVNLGQAQLLLVGGSFIVDVARYIGSQVGDFKKAATRLNNSQMDAKTVHQLRVSTRRIRAVLWVLRHDWDVSWSALDSLSRHMKEVARVLGARRELDVTIQMAKHYGLDAKHLYHRQQVAGKRLVKFFSLHGATILARLEKTAAKLKDELPKKRCLGSSDKLKKRLSKWQSNLPKTQEELHELRIFVKKIRYILEARNLGPYKLINELQSLLGMVHDLEVLSKLAGSTPKTKQAAKETLEGVAKIQQKTLRFIATRL